MTYPISSAFENDIVRTVLKSLSDRLTQQDHAREHLTVRVPNLDGFNKSLPYLFQLTPTILQTPLQKTPPQLIKIFNKCAPVNKMGPFVKLWNPSEPARLTFQSTDLKITPFTISIKNSRVKLEQDSSSLNFQFCNFKDIADSEVEDADDKLFILKSDVMTEIVWKFHCWIVWIFFLFLIADYNVDGAVDEPSIFYYWRLRGQEFESRGGGQEENETNVPTRNS